MEKLNELKHLVTALGEKSRREGCSVHDIVDFVRKAHTLIDEAAEPNVSDPVITEVKDSRPRIVGPGFPKSGGEYLK